LGADLGKGYTLFLRLRRTKKEEKKPRKAGGRLTWVLVLRGLKGVEGWQKNNFLKGWATRAKKGVKGVGLEAFIWGDVWL